MLRILLKLLAELIRLLLGFTLHAASLLLGCFVRLLYWSVRVYGWGRVFGFFGALILSGWINLRLIPSMEIEMLRMQSLLLRIPVGTAFLWIAGWAILHGLNHAWRSSSSSLPSIPSQEQTRHAVEANLQTTPTPPHSHFPLPSVTIPNQSGPLWQQVTSWENLSRAWQRVETNGGGAGPDGITLEAFAMDWENRLHQLHHELITWRYRPQPPRYVEVPKSSGGLRRLAIFNLHDRIVQQALNQILLPLWDIRFAPCSYAYRPGRSAHQAVNDVEKALQNGRLWVVDADIKSFFDSVPHPRLLRQLESWLEDESARAIVSLMLTTASPNAVGLPQGSAISPLLSNLYLHAFDEAMLQRGYSIYRYADDFVILCPTREQAEEALQCSQRLLKALQLRLNEQKTRIVHIDESFDFLGFTFTTNGKRPSQEAIRSLNERLHNTSDETKRQQIANGWRAYFNNNNNEEEKEKMDDPFQLQNQSQYHSSVKGIMLSELSESDWNLYCQRFIGRSDLFARYWQNENGQCGYLPVRRAISKQDIESHLSGQTILGSYLLNPESQTRALVFDIDGPTLDDSGRQKAHQLAMQLIQALSQQGINPLLLDSGGKGRHLWLCFTELAPAKPIRQWAQSFLDRLRPFPDGVLVEVFPKQDFLPTNALGAMIRLPLGRHPQTNRFGAILNSNGQQELDPWHALRTHPLINPANLVSTIPTTTCHPSSIPSPPEAIAPMIKGCSLLWGLVEKAAREHHLKHTERLSLLYTLGHCGDAGCAYLHQVIALCSNYNPRITERFIQRLDEGQKAISCSRLKEWLKDYLPGVACECPKKKNPSPIDWLKLAKKTDSTPQMRKPTQPVSDSDWKTIAEDLFDFTDSPQ